MQKTQPLTLRRNFSWTFIGNAVYAACQWGMLVVLAKLGSPEMVGQFSLGFAVTAPVVMFTNLQLRQVQATDAKQQYLFGDYLALRLIATGLALLIIAGIAFSKIYPWETALVILLVGLAKAVESVSDVFHGLFQHRERMDRIAISMMLKGPMSLLLLVIGVYVSGSVAWGVIGLICAGTIVLIAYDIPRTALLLSHPSPILQSQELQKTQLADTLKPRWHLRKLGKLAWLTLPLGLGMMLVSLNSNIPNYLIENYLGGWELGIFAAIAYLMEIGNRVVIALGESAVARLAQYYAAGKSILFLRLLFKLVGIGALLGGTGVLVSLIAGKQVLTFIYRPEYAQYTNLLVWLAIAAGIRYMANFLGYGMTAARYFRIQMPLFGFVTVILAVASLWLLPKVGLIGGAIALLLAAIAQGVISLAAIYHALFALNKRTSKI
ncbi:lipopolysaccharide biosynthesis protein [Fischerella sp. PCC 9605]|uniref:lipopolysaccharide biosynthesis protein n=1 Tax=Fischerella sp. PCC 9605 TaxID=1173024 RepID=UPI00047D2573|nr:oligosaccharide flippase family protein [Fischerella sp. PCC 9605]